MRRTVSVLCLLVVGCAAHMHSSAASFRDRIAGCYKFREAAWRTDSLLNRPYRVATLPTGIQLRRSLLKSWGEQEDTLPVFEVAPLGIATTEFPFLHWQQDSVGSETFRVARSPAFQGAALSLRLEGSALVGTITSFTDAIPRDGVAHVERPIVLDRVSCG